MNKITSRIDNVTNNVGVSTICPPPISVKIELSSHCNLKCNFCAHGSIQRMIHGSMKIGLFDSIIKDLKEFGVKEIGLFYIGESFMCSWLSEAIFICKKKYGISYTFLTTNGILANENNLKSIFENGLDSLKFSYNSFDEEEFAKVTNCNGNLIHKLNDNIKLAKRIRDEGEYKCGLYASSIFQPDNPKMEPCLDLNVRPYVDEHYFLPLYNHGGFLKDGRVINGGNTGRLDRPRDPIPCWTLFKEGHITSDGDISACCFGHAPSFIFGNCREQKFSEVWNNEKYQSIRKLHLSENLNDLKNSICGSCLLL